MFRSCASLLLVLTAVVTHATGNGHAFRMASLFTDHMVIQREADIPLWGTGVPGTTVSITGSWGVRSSTLVGEDGNWMAFVGTPGAGGPLAITVAHARDTVRLQDVLAGEVWICSGQSNMEMPLRGWPPRDPIAHSEREIANASNPQIRLFTVERAVSAVPEAACTGTWTECSPSTAAGFSATGYFFGKNLQASLGVPVGLIQTSWGGTPVEAWTSADFLARVGAYDTTLVRLRESARMMPAFNAWLSRFPVIVPEVHEGAVRAAGLDLGDGPLAAPSYDDRMLPEMQLPVVWERTSLGLFDGAVWFRRHVSIPRAWLSRELTLELGPIDDLDVTYVNGVRCGGMESAQSWREPRVYRVPASAVDTTDLVIAVRVIDTYGAGGIYGAPEQLRLRLAGGGESIPLAGGWKYQIAALYRGGKFHAFGTNGAGFEARERFPIEVGPGQPSCLYNAMIAPLAPFRVRGAIWYQGESNVATPGLYAEVFPVMIRNWRVAFRDPAMPFYFVQIAPFAYNNGGNSAFLREAQVKTLALPQTGMAVTLDIGDPANIHPANKADVGKRLALLALARTHGRKVVDGGPAYRSAVREGTRMMLSFDNPGRGLVLRPSGGSNGFRIAGADGVFQDARVRLEGARLAVWHPDVRVPASVRYAFTDTAQATLFNREGLPASSFRTDTWDR